MRAGGSAGTSGDAQARLVRVGDKSELGDRTDHRRRAARVKANDHESPPGGEPQTVRCKRPRTIDQCFEPAGVDFAEGRRRADHDRRSEDVRTKDVAQRRASLRTRARLRLAAGLREYCFRPSALNKRAHPSRRRFAGAGKGEERPAEPRGDIAGFVGRAFRG